ncbi:MAG: hypothetical protein AAGF84_11730 [Planctomycetota bacterium]
MSEENPSESFKNLGAWLLNQLCLISVLAFLLTTFYLICLFFVILAGWSGPAAPKPSFFGRFLFIGLSIPIPLGLFVASLSLPMAIAGAVVNIVIQAGCVAWSISVLRRQTE